MTLESFFPFWDKLTKTEKEMLKTHSFMHHIEKGTIIHDGGKDCAGLVLVCQGLFRSYVLSDEGKEITINRLFERDICVLCASCVMKNIQFEIIVQAEKDSDVWIIPPYIYKKIVEESVAFSNYMNDLMASCVSEIMWLMEQIMWKSIDSRLAQFLIEESNVEESMVLKLTHEKIANHLGTAREVITRMLKYFQSEGIVQLRRGIVEIVDFKKLESL